MAADEPLSKAIPTRRMTVAAKLTNGLASLRSGSPFCPIIYIMLSI